LRWTRIIVFIADSVQWCGFAECRNRATALPLA